jgi:hypothetical protein
MKIPPDQCEVWQNACETEKSEVGYLNVYKAWRPSLVKEIRLAYGDGG